MVRCLTLAVVLLLGLAPDAGAGAWLREKGTAFVELSGQVTEPDEYGFHGLDAGLYAEYGLAERLTLGVDAGHDMLRVSKAVVFLRLPLGRETRKTKLAVELGAGQVGDDTALRPGLSIGRGLRLWDRSGWLNADGRVVLARGGAMTLESDLTAGLSITARAKIILQLQLGQPDTGTGYATLAPSVVYETKPGTHLELGLTQPLAGGDLRGVSLDIWRTF
ncbi:hypothetical protein ACROSR_06400 [Roseovarius tibetensis]|uniref:hypothetical protein n=1 Tax=Roseovarius tibetensis TaxID=2685897 RepID=UPI003D7FD8EC